MAHQDIHTLKTIYTIELKLDFHSKLGNLKGKDIAMTVTQDLTPNERKTTVIPRIKIVQWKLQWICFFSLWPHQGNEDIKEENSIKKVKWYK